MDKIVLIGSSSMIAAKFCNVFSNQMNILTFGRTLKHDSFFDLEKFESFKNVLQVCDHRTTVLFFSAISSPEYAEKNVNDTIKINYEATCNLIDSLLKNKTKVIFLSSDGIYGANPSICSESEAPRPLGVYAFTKFLVEQRFKDHILFKSVRLSYVLSSEDSFSKYVSDAVHGQLKIEAYGSLRRNIVCINDVLDGLRKLCENFDIVNSQYINFSGYDCLSRYDLAKLLLQIRHNALNMLRQVEPKNEFWQCRAKVIQTKSDYFEKVLGRSITKVEDYINHEK